MTIRKSRQKRGKKEKDFGKLSPLTKYLLTQSTAVPSEVLSTYQPSLLIAKNFPGIALQTYTDLRPIFIKGLVRSITGYSEKEFTRGQIIWGKIVHPQDLQKYRQSTEKLRTIPGFLVEREYRIIRRSGQIRWINEVIQNISDKSGQPVLIQSIIHNITERKQAEKRLAAQLQIVTTLTRMPIIRVNLANVLKIIGKTLGWEVGALWLVDPNNTQLRCSEIWSESFIKIPQFRKLSRQLAFGPGEGLPGKVWEKGQPIWLVDFTKDDSLPRAKVASTEDLHSAFAFPLKSRGQVLGIMEFFSKDIRQPDKEAQKIIEALSKQIGQFLAHRQGELEREQLLTQVTRGEERAEQLAVESEKHANELDAVFMALADPVLVFDSQGILVSANPIAFTTLGSQLLGKNCYDLAKMIAVRYLDNRPVAAKDLPSSLALKGKTLVNQPLIITKPNGEDMAAIVTASPVFSDNKISGAVVSLHDISERLKLEKQKDEFIAIASHELKTPITTLKALTQILEQRHRRIGDEPELQYLNKFSIHLDKLSTLISDLLNVTKMESGNIELKPRKINFESFLRETVEDFQRTENSHCIEIKGSFTGKVNADKDRLSQVITNLLSNAVKYSPGSNLIIVQLTHSSHNLRVGVKDFGVGIPTKFKEKIFDRFFRAKGPQGERFPGLGLGLYIANEIVKLHHGKMWVKSGEGRGSTFFFTLPL